MLRVTSVLSTMLLVFLYVCGCSSGAVSPIGSDPNQDMPLLNNQIENRHLLGKWNVEFNVEDNTAAVVAVRDVDAHINVTYLIPPPILFQLGYDPVLSILDLNVGISNPYPNDGYDLRLIIFSKPGGARLVNPDNWTSLWDIPGGSSINPFKAYADDVENRRFGSSETHYKQIQFEIPSMAFSLTIAIDASWPGNCEEPFLMDNFTQTDLYSVVDSWSKVRVEVYDWQHNIDEVELFCPMILGSSSLRFSLMSGPSVPAYPPGYKYGYRLKNNTGAGPGNFKGYIKASSENSTELALYDVIDIEVKSGTETPHAPIIVGDILVRGSVRDVELDGNYAYLATSYGLVIVDISDPVYPESISEYNLAELSPRGIEYHNEKAYVVTRTTVEVFSVSDPGNPFHVISVDLYRPQDLVVAGDYAYVADYNEGLKVIDINTGLIAGIADTNKAMDVVVKGDFAYIADGNKGLKIIDIHDPTDPFITGSYNMSFARSVKVEGDYAYVADSNKGLRIFDISDSYNPILVGYTSNFRAQNMDVEDDYAYVIADDPSNIKIFDVADQHFPTLYSTIETGESNAIAVRGKFAYVGSYRGSFKVIKLW